MWTTVSLHFRLNRTLHSQPMSSAASDSKTEVGSYFISNYPPYSQWKKDSLDEVRAALGSPPTETTPLGLYLHIPFCRKRCKFCYFKVFTDVTAPEVQRNVLLSIRSNKLNTYAVRAALRDMKTEDPRLARERTALLDSLERASRTAIQRFWDAALEPRNYGLYAVITVAGLAVLICVPVLLYFAARCFVYLSARHWRALTALGILITWVGASCALGWAFFIGAFMAGGHNSQPPLDAQLTVVGVLLLLVGVYALLGYGLRRMVRT